MLIETNLEKPSFVVIALNLASAMLERKALADHGILNYKAVEGSYKGEKERSYVVTFQTLEDLQQILHVARTYKQESILVVDVERNAQLMFLNTYSGGTMPKYVGKFKNVPKFEALEQEAWTYDPENNYYYICKEA